MHTVDKLYGEDFAPREYIVLNKCTSFLKAGGISLVYIIYIKVHIVV